MAAIECPNKCGYTRAELGNGERRQPFRASLPSLYTFTLNAPALYTLILPLL